MSPCDNVHFDEAESQVSTDTESDSESQCTDRALQEIRGDLIVDSQQQRQHFFVPPRGDQENDTDDHVHQDDGGSCVDKTEPLPPNVSSLLDQKLLSRCPHGATEILSLITLIRCS